MRNDNAVQSAPVASDDRIREALRKQINRCISLDRTHTRAELATESGVSIHQIDQLASQNPDKHRRVCMADAFSIAWVIGPRAVNALLAVIGYGGAKPLDEVDAVQPMLLTATALTHLSTIATAAADGRIDHTEEPACREAADQLIAVVLPLSSVRQDGKA